MLLLILSGLAWWGNRDGVNFQKKRNSIKPFYCVGLDDFAK
jgi:hypothetical protein